MAIFSKLARWGLSGIGSALSLIEDVGGEKSEFSPPPMSMAEFRRKQDTNKKAPLRSTPRPKPRPRKRQVVDSGVINIDGVFNKKEPPRTKIQTNVYGRKRGDSPTPKPMVGTMDKEEGLSDGQKLAIGAGLVGLAGLYLGSRKKPSVYHKRVFSNRFPS